MKLSLSLSLTGDEQERGAWEAKQGENEHLGLLRVLERIRRRERSRPR